MEVITHSTEETKRLAEKLASDIKSGDILALYGELGAGKTTFTGFLTQALGGKSRVQSPTFVIARTYEAAKNGIKKIYHLDLYRLHSQQELEELDFKNFITDSAAIAIIEWPEVADKLLPTNCIKIKFEHVDENTRKIYVENIH